MFIPFLLVHFFTAHKELRFLFPLINFIPLFVVLSWQEIEHSNRFEKLKTHLIRLRFYLIKPFFWIGNSILLIVLCFKPADNYTPTISFIYYNYSSNKTQVLFTDNNPYDKNNCLNFYKSSDLSVQQISIDTLTYTDLDKYSHSLVVASKDEISKIKMRGFEVKKVYSTIPDFMYTFNFNNWINRTAKTEIYELTINPYIR
jgi:phosphatidylinositol glycan class B